MAITVDAGGGVRLYGRQLIREQAGKFRWLFTRVAKPVETTADGASTMVGLVIGDTDATAHNPADWSATTSTSDVDTMATLVGSRTLFANTDTVTAGVSDRFRTTLYTGTRRTAVAPAETEIVADLGVGVERTMELEWRVSFLALRCIDLGLEQTWSNAALGVPAGQDRVLFFYVSPLSDSIIRQVRRTA